MSDMSPIREQTDIFCSIHHHFVWIFICQYFIIIINLFIYLFKLQMGFYPVAVYYNKTQHTNNTKN
jgi:hypothetical protein